MTSAAENSGQTVEMFIGVRVTDGQAEITTSASEPVSRRHRPITRDEARELTDRIRITLARTWELLVTAYTDRAWSALGYQTWDAYCTGEFGDTRIPIPREEREVTVASLRAAGLSYRAIGAATNISKSTAKRLDGSSTVPDGTVDGKTLGTDGKWRPSSRLESEPVEVLPSDDGVIDGWVGDGDDLIPCDDCGEGHAPEVSVCPFLLSASSGPVFEDTERLYGPGADSAESAGVVNGRDPLDDEFDAMLREDFSGSDVSASPVSPAPGGASSGLAQLRVVALAIDRLRVAREDLEELPSLASDVSDSLALLELDPEVTIPDQGLAVMIRDSAAGIRAQIKSLAATLELWDSLAERLEATMY